MSDFDLRQIADIIVEHSYPPGKVLIEEMTEAECFYIIYKGKIEISKRFEGFEKYVLSVKSDGDFFGEMALLDEGPRSATVCTLEPTTVFQISKVDFDSLLFKAPLIAYRILKENSARLRETGALLISYLNKGNRQLYRAYIDTMSIVAHAIENRNAQNSGLNYRIVNLAKALGRELELSDEDLLILELGVLVHDLGMLAVPERLLNKVDPLDKGEFEMIKKHTQQTVEMIRNIPFLQKVIPVILGHHEHYNGTGYPDGLTGDKIPLVARVLAVVDAYDSMTTEKPYRKRMTVKQAIEELKREAGTQFDPRIVKAFVKMHDSGAIGEIEKNLK